MTRLSSLLLTALCASATPLLAQDWLIDDAVAAMDLSQRIATRQTAGYLPVSLTVDKASGTAEFSIVWARNPTNVAWNVVTDLSQAGLGAELSSQSALGFRPSCLDLYGDYGERYYAAVFVHDLATFGPVTVVSTVLPNQLAATVATQQANGRQPYWIGAGCRDSEARACALFSANAPAAEVLANVDLATFQSWVAAETANQDVVFATAHSLLNGADRYFGVSRASTVAVDFNASVQPTELSALTRWQLNQDKVPVSVCSHPDPNQGRQIHIGWQSTTQAKVWSATGAAGLAGIDAAMQTYMQGGDVPTAVVAITKDGRLVHLRGYNYNATGLQAAQPRSEARIGSMSKTLTAIGVMRLIDEGLLGLNQQVGSIAGLDLSTWSASKKQITVKQLLMHTSGIGSTAIVNNEETIAAAMNQPLPTTPQMWVDYMGTQTFPNAPGTVYEYSNFGYCLLGRIIEAVTGESYDDYMNRHVLGPVHAGRARLAGTTLDQQMPNELPYRFGTSGYDTSVLGDGATVPYVYGGFNMATGDSLGSWAPTAECYARVLCAFDDPANSPLLSAGAISAMWARDPNTTPTGNYYGLGWNVNVTTGLRWHGGSIRGSHAKMGMRTDGINYVVIIGTENPGGVGPNGADLDGTIEDAINAVTNWPPIDLWDGMAAFGADGHGCGGPSGTPGIRLRAGTQPQLGENVTLDVHSLPTVMPLALMMVGFDVAPIDIDFLGYPGCTLYPLSPQFLSIGANNGDAEWTLHVPQNPNLIGAPLHCQALTFDPFLATQVVTSHLGTLWLGQ